MATKEKTTGNLTENTANQTPEGAASLIEDPTKLVPEGAEAPKPGTRVPDERDKRLAEMEAKLAEAEAKLAAAEKMNAAMAAGNDFEVVQQKCQEAAEKGINPWTIDIEIRVPARRDSNDPYYWLNINGRSAQLPANNSYQKMKLPFAETLVNMIRAEEHAKNCADEEIQVKDPITNPHEKEEIRK